MAPEITGVDGRRLRQISYGRPDGVACTIYAALSDAELVVFSPAPTPQQVWDMKRLVHVVVGRPPSEEDDRLALEVFAHVHGARAIRHG